MTFKELYAVCENLSHSTYFEIRSTCPYNGNGELLADGKYIDLHAKWYGQRITGFKLDTQWNFCIIYV